MPRALIAALVLLCSTMARGDDKPSPAVASLSFSPDGKTLAAGLVVGDKGELLLREAASSKVRWRQPQPAGVRAVCFLSGGKTLVAAVGPSLLLIDAATGKTTGTLGKYDKAIASLALSPDGKTLASGGWDRAVKLWDVGKGKEIRSLRESGVVYSLAFAPDGKGLLCAAEREAALWDATAGEKVVAFANDRYYSPSALFLPDSEVLIGGRDGTARLFDAGDGNRKMVLHGFGGVVGMCYEPRTKRFAVYDHRNVSLFGFDRRPDAATTKQIGVLVTQLDDDDYGKREAAEAALVAIGMRAEATLREARSAKSAEVRIRARRAWQTLLSKPGVRIEFRARTAAFSPDGKILALAGGEAIGLYDPQTGKPLSEAKE